jgi:hypothetical protein
MANTCPDRPCRPGKVTFSPAAIQKLKIDCTPGPERVLAELRATVTVRTDGRWAAASPDHKHCGQEALLSV